MKFHILVVLLLIAATAIDAFKLLKWKKFGKHAGDDADAVRTYVTRHHYHPAQAPSVTRYVYPAAAVEPSYVYHRYHDVADTVPVVHKKWWKKKAKWY